jgi:hypothetical protein
MQIYIAKKTPKTKKIKIMIQQLIVIPKEKKVQSRIGKGLYCIIRKLETCYKSLVENLD